MIPAIRGKLKKIIQYKSRFEKPPKLLFLFQAYIPFRPPIVGKSLYSCEPAFRSIIDRCSYIFESISGYNLAKVFTDDGEAERMLANDGYNSVAFVSLQLALCELWRSYGVNPDAVIGLSSGEIAAAYAAGALSIEDAIMIMRCMRLNSSDDKGKIIRLFTDGKTTKRLCEIAPAQLYLVSELSSLVSQVFCLNEDVDRILNFFEEQNIEYRDVTFSVPPFHTPLYFKSPTAFINNLSTLNPSFINLPFYSTKSGGKASSSTLFNSDYWKQMCTQPMLFYGAYQSAIEDDYTISLEISTHPIHLLSMNSIADDKSVELLHLCSIQNDISERTTFENTYQKLNSLGLVKRT